MIRTLTIEFDEEACVIQIDGVIIGTGDEYGTFSFTDGERLTPPTQVFEQFIEAASGLMTAESS